MKVTIFTKVFCWLFICYLCVITANFVVFHFVSDKIRIQPVPERLKSTLVSTEKRVSNWLLSQSPEQLSRNSRIETVYFVSSDKMDLFGKPLPELLTRLDSHVHAANQTASIVTNNRIIYGGSPASYQGREYRVYISWQLSYLSDEYISMFLKDFLTSISLTTLLLAGPLSFFMSWFITRPIKQLQYASASLEEDLENTQGLDSMLIRDDEFGDLARDTLSMASALKAQFDARDELLGNISHELKSPLARQRIAIELLRNKQLTQEQIRELNRIARESEKLDNMLGKLLQHLGLSQVSSVSKIPINLNELLESTISDARYEAKDKVFYLSNHMKSDVVSYGDEQALSSCFENVLRNAIKYANKDIHIALKMDNESLLSIEIADDGTGVAEQDLDSLFEPFFRADKHRSREFGGVGLGLAIAKAAIELHGGKISACNNVHGGLTVKILLPITASAASSDL